jgi:tRNA nucleotidyltransferase (CCA-adding enzyme)
VYGVQTPAPIAAILRRLEEAGYAAYVVGGCVRDTLMGQEPHDWDIATAATPEQVKQVFADARILETGLQHGTLTLLLPGCCAEVTTFRADGTYLDGRRPQSVCYLTSIEQDLARRDFTMNALAYSENSGFVDPFGGRSDIAAKLVRSVGNPDERLHEDALRIMRALRFSSTLGFRIDEELSTSLHINAGLLARIAPERLCDELLKLLAGSHVLAVLLAYPDVLAVPIPEISPTVGHDQRTPYHRLDIWEHTAHAVAASRADAPVRLTLLMHDLGKPETFFIDDNGQGHFYGHDKRGAEIARDRLQALRMSSRYIDAVSQAVRYHQLGLRPENLQKWLSRLGEDMVRLLIEVKRGDLAAHTETVASKGLTHMDACERRLDELIAEQACFKLSDLAVNGTDLVGIGIAQGPEIGRILTYLLESVCEGELENTRPTLLAAAEDSILPPRE